MSEKDEKQQFLFSEMPEPTPERQSDSCPVCGSRYVDIGSGSPYAACPNGHGRLVPALPEATRRRSRYRRSAGEQGE